MAGKCDAFKFVKTAGGAGCFCVWNTEVGRFSLEGCGAAWLPASALGELIASPGNGLRTVAEGPELLVADSGPLYALVRFTMPMETF